MELACLLCPLSPSAAGISRSVTITVVYLMSVSTLNFHEALSVVQYCREVANPNMGFRTQLAHYHENIKEHVRLHV